MPRTRKGLTPRKSQYRNARTFFIIASEGNKTENQYFNGLKKQANPKVEIEVLERNNTNSSPHDVITQLDTYTKEYVLVEGDELWLVIDRDYQSWSEKQISEIAQLCFQKKYFLGLSNPCFELWLLLHISDVHSLSPQKKKSLLENKRVSTSRNKIEKELLTILGSYNKSNLNLDNFIPRVKSAIEGAKKLDKSIKSRWINGIGTRVYQLVEKLIS